MGSHTAYFYEHVYLGLKPRYIFDTPMTIKSWFYIWLEQRVCVRVIQLKVCRVLTWYFETKLRSIGNCDNLTVK